MFKIGITVLLDMAFFDGITDYWISIAKGGFAVVLLEMRESVREFRGKILAKGVIIEHGIGGFVGTGCSPNIELGDVVEMDSSGSSIAGGDWEEAGGIEAIFIHLFEGIMKIVGIDIVATAIWNTKNSTATMIIIENENIIVFGGFESNTSRRIAKKNFVEVFGCDCSSNIINFVGSWIDVGVVKFTENLAFEWVGGRSNNVVIAHQDDMVVIIASIFKDLVLIVGIGCVTIVVELVRSSKDHSPVLG